MEHKKKIILIMACICLVISILLGITYAWFNYTTEGTNQKLVAGDIYLTMGDTGNGISLTNIFPETKEEARARNDNYMTFTLSGLNTSDKDIYYEIKLKYGEDKASPKMRYTDSDLVFDLVEIGSNNEETYIVDAKSYDSFNDKRIWVDTIDHNTTTEITRTYKLRMWLSEDVIISDTDANANYQATGDNAFKNYYGNVKVEVFGDFNEKEPPLDGRGKVLKAINAKINAETNACNPIYEEDGIKYFSGTNDCVDMNYVWYSGKLWRITAIYPDGTMKMITEDALTAINWGSTDEYDGSWIYQWLNEDFYDTLVSSNNIIVNNVVWNYSGNNNSTIVRPETIENQRTKESPIGLLNAYEYYNAYQNASTSTNYLNTGYFWWLITTSTYSESYVFSVDYNGDLYSYTSSMNDREGVRPSIVIKSELEFIGNGTRDVPYRIVGDKENPTSGALINGRSVGEYVKFDNDIYRIVSIDETNGTTKLTRVDYLRDNGTIITKNFASTAFFGKSTNTGEDTYWDYYLNNTWYNNISSAYKNMLVDGIYYLGLYAGSGKHYKITTCKELSYELDNISTKDCTKYTSTDTDKTFTGKVGLPRVGEMFSAQLGSGSSSSVNIWLITPYSTSSVRYMHKDGDLYSNSPTGNTLGVRPSITLKSGIKITGGTGYVGGETNNPFEISE